MIADIMYDLKEHSKHIRKVISETSALICCIFFLMGLPNNGNAQSPQEIAKKAFRSTVLLVMEDANGQPVALGSGFFVREGIVVSNLHVIEGAARGYAKIVGQKAKLDIEGTVGIDPVRDLVLLKISGLSTPPLSLGNSDAVEIGEPVYAGRNLKGTLLKIITLHP